MRQYFVIAVTIALVILVLVAVNAASYVEIEQRPDSEFNPDRSTYNSRATGTRALFDYLQESGYKVVRWREQPGKMVSAAAARPETFLVIGPTQIPFEPEEVDDLLRWVRLGGRLVLVDRSPDQRLLPASENWRMSVELQTYPSPDARSGNADDMTAGVPLARATQPTVFTGGVDSVLASRFASVIKIFAVAGTTHKAGQEHETGAKDDDDYRLGGKSIRALQEEPPPPVALPPASQPEAAKPSSTEYQTAPAPVLQLGDVRGALLADYHYGSGRIVVLSDPFIIANNGINRADNLHLALNLVAGSGIIAFDEYHHGRAATENQLISYFSGTPILAMIGQLGLIVLVVLWTSGTRFGRALPLPFIDRRSKLEFVASMAELQQRARAYDLALENIYVRTRRVLARYAGLDGNSSSKEIAERVASRSQLNAQELEALMRECEDAMAGEPLSGRRALELVTKLKGIERALGLRMRSREIKQAKSGG